MSGISRPRTGTGNVCICGKRLQTPQWLTRHRRQCPDAIAQDKQADAEENMNRIREKRAREAEESRAMQIEIVRVFFLQFTLYR